MLSELFYIAQIYSVGLCLAITIHALYIILIDRGSHASNNELLDKTSSIERKLMLFVDDQRNINKKHYKANFNIHHRLRRIEEKLSLCLECEERTNGELWNWHNSYEPLPINFCSICGNKAKVPAAEATNSYKDYYVPESMRGQNL